MTNFTNSHSFIADQKTDCWWEIALMVTGKIGFLKSLTENYFHLVSTFRMRKYLFLVLYQACFWNIVPMYYLDLFVIKLGCKYLGKLWNKFLWYHLNHLFLNSINFGDRENSHHMSCCSIPLLEKVFWFLLRKMSCDLEEVW